MARLKRRWRVAKWAAAVAALFVLLLWGLSVPFSWHFAATPGPRTYGLRLREGCVEARFGPAASPGFQQVVVRRSAHLPRWTPRITVRTAGGWWLILVPLWIPCLALSTLAGYLFWLDRRRFPLHCCQGCGYDLTGNTSGRCPECGQKLAILLE